MRRIVEFLIMCAATVLASGTPLAAEPPTTAEVLAKIHRANQKEMDMGRMAVQVGHAKDVRSFGKTLMNDHQAAEKKVQKLAKEENVALTETAVANEESGLPTGDAFDATFAQRMLDDHQKLIVDLEAARETTSDDKLKKLLGDLLPVLHRHESTAHHLVDQTTNRS
jgi:putative membrane protein